MGFTFFFRDNHTLERAIHQLIANSDKNSFIKIWDAGCERGPEPFTFLMLLDKICDQTFFNNVKMDLSDLDEMDTFGKTIKKACYPYSELKRIPEEYFKEYFEKTNDENVFRVVDKLQRKIDFVKHDLLTYHAISNNYDMIICKNVLLHFSEEQRKLVYRMFHSSLKKNALLVHEQTQKVPESLSHLFVKISNDAGIYRKQG